MSHKFKNLDISTKTTMEILLSLKAKIYPNQKKYQKHKYLIMINFSIDKMT